MIKNQKEALNVAPIAELQALCLYPLFNLVTMGGFTVCADVIFNLGITNHVLLCVSVLGLVLGGLSGLAHSFVYIRQAAVKKNPVTSSFAGETMPFMNF